MGWLALKTTVLAVFTEHALTYLFTKTNTFNEIA